MPFASLSQRRLFFAKEKAGELPPGTAARWNEHTPKDKKLPEKVGDAGKKAFVRDFLIKCAVDGITDPAALVNAAEQLVIATKKADGFWGFLGDAAKTVGGAAAGLAPYGPVLGHVAPVVGGFGLGAGAAVLKNQMDKDDTKVMRLAALANAYKRRTAEARTNAEVRKVVESDPSRYLVLS